MLTVFVSDVVVTAVILNTTFIRALTSLAIANTAVYYYCVVFSAAVRCVQYSDII